MNSFDDINESGKKDCENHFVSILKSATFLSHLEDCQLSSEKGLEAIMATVQIRRDYNDILSFGHLRGLAVTAQSDLLEVLSANGYKFYGIFR